MPRKFLSPERYAEAMEALIIVCADAVFIQREKKHILLAKRRAKPIPGWWFIGGRINAGEDECEGLLHKIRQETSLVLSQDRLSYLSMNRYVCSERQQEPQNKGSDTLAYTFAIELSEQEQALIAANLDEHEYERSTGLRAFDRGTLVSENLHPAIVDAYDQIFGTLVV